MVCSLIYQSLNVTSIVGWIDAQCCILPIYRFIHGHVHIIADRKPALLKNLALQSVMDNCERQPNQVQKRGFEHTPVGQSSQMSGFLKSMLLSIRLPDRQSTYISCLSMGRTRYTFMVKGLVNQF